MNYCLRTTFFIRLQHTQLDRFSFFPAPIVNVSKMKFAAWHFSLLEYWFLDFRVNSVFFAHCCNVAVDEGAYMKRECFEKQFYFFGRNLSFRRNFQLAEVCYKILMGSSASCRKMERVQATRKEKVLNLNSNRSTARQSFKLLWVIFISRIFGTTSYARLYRWCAGDLWNFIDSSLSQVRLTVLERRAYWTRFNWFSRGKLRE